MISIMTGFSVQVIDVNTINNLLNDRYTIVKVILEPYTPWWGGDYSTATMKHRWPYVTPLNSETVKGVTRWIVRLVAAALAADKRDLRRVDELIGLLFGYTGETHNTRKSIVELHVHPAINIETYGWHARRCVEKVRRCLENVYRLILQGIDTRSYARSPVCWIRLLIGVLETLYEYDLLVKNLSEEGAKELVSKIFDAKFPDVLRSIIRSLVTGRECKSLRNNINYILRNDKLSRLIELIARDRCLYAIAGLVANPRVKLNLINAEDIDQLLEKLPLPYACSPSCRFAYQVELRIDGFEASLLLGRGLHSQLASLAIAAVALAAALHGFGRGGARGFGRFIPRLADGSNLIDSEVGRLVSELAKSMKDGDAHGFADKSQKLLISMARLLVEIGVVEEPEDGLEERIKNSIDVHTIGPIHHPLPLPVQAVGYRQSEQVYKILITSGTVGQARQAGLVRRVRPPDEIAVLDAIARSVLKSVWKLYCGASTTSMGETFHTWILGLPRNQKGNGYGVGNCREAGRRKSPVIMTPIGKTNSWYVVIMASKLLEDYKERVGSLIVCGKHGTFNVVDIATCRAQVSVKCHTGATQFVNGIVGWDSGRVCGACPTHCVATKNVADDAVREEIINKVFEASLAMLKRVLL